MITTKDILTAILDYTPQYTEQRLIPAMLGMTGSGKTTTARIIAKERGKRLVVLLPGTSLPEDILGLPKAIHGKTVYTEPEWFALARTEPCIVFIDEFDKARPEVNACLLTLMADRHIRNVKLHPETEIICAGQPVPGYWASDESNAAYAARVVWVAMPYQWNDIEKVTRRSLSWMPSTPAIELPVLPYPSPRSILWLSGFANKHRDNEDLVFSVATGILPHVLIKEFLAAKGTIGYDPVEVYLSLEKDDLPDYILSLAPAELIELSIAAVTPPAQGTRSSIYVWAPLLGVELSGDRDLLKEALRRINERWGEAANNNTPIISREDTPEAREDLVAFFRVGARWSEYIQNHPEGVDKKKALVALLNKQGPEEE